MITWNCLQWGRSSLVDPAEWPKIGLLNRGFAKGVAGTVSLLIFFRFLPFSSVFFRFLPVFFRFLPFFSVSFCFYPFHFQKKGETPFARPLLRNPDLTGVLGGNMFRFSSENSKTQSSLNLHQSGPRYFANSDFPGSAPIR